MTFFLLAQILIAAATTHFFFHSSFYTLLFILIVISLLYKLNGKLYGKKVALTACFLFAFSPWVLRGGGDIYGGNIYQFLSFKLLFFNASFFQNIGKETGVVFPSYLPFVAIGVYRLIEMGNIKSIIAFLTLIVVSSLSPGILVKQEFFIIVAILSYVAATGLATLAKQKSRYIHMCLWIGLLGIIYELGQYLHYILLHFLHDAPTLGI